MDYEFQIEKLNSYKKEANFLKSEIKNIDNYTVKVKQKDNNLNLISYIVLTAKIEDRPNCEDKIIIEFLGSIQDSITLERKYYDWIKDHFHIYLKENLKDRDLLYNILGTKSLVLEVKTYHTLLEPDIMDLALSGIKYFLRNCKILDTDYDLSEFFEPLDTTYIYEVLIGDNLIRPNRNQTFFKQGSYSCFYSKKLNKLNLSFKAFEPLLSLEELKKVISERIKKIL